MMAGDDFDAFFRAVLPRTVAAARRVTGDRAAAEDAAVEALARAHLHWARVAPLPWRDAWVLRVAIHQALRQRPRPAPTPVAGAPAPEGPDASDRPALVAALRALPRRQRQAVVLRYLGDLSEADVAAALGVRAGTVKTHLRRGLDRLRAELGDSWQEGGAHG